MPSILRLFDFKRPGALHIIILIRERFFMQNYKFYLAPLRGITDHIFRDVYERHFGRFDFMLAPFVPTVRGDRVRDYHIVDLLREEERTRLIPQVIGSDSAGFLLLCNKFADMGFSSVNWNLGCPAPLITKKSRGCGLLPHGDIIKRFLDDVIPKLPIPMSIKTRLGLDKNDELYNLMSAFNKCQLREIIIHPRTGAQAYGGKTDLDKFEECLRISKHTIVYNGDICSIDDFKYLAKRFPTIENWMIGRGIIKNPFLLNELKNEVDNSEKTVISEKEKVKTKQEFLNNLLTENLNHYNPTKVLGKMKELWQYMGTNKEKILHCETIEEYREMILTLTLRF